MSNLSALEYIQNRSEATTGLFNQRFSVISANFAALNSTQTISFPSGNTLSVFSSLDASGNLHAGNRIGVGVTPSADTVEVMTIGADSSKSDYILFHDPTGARSSYVIGSRVGGTADGLNIWDASGSTMIASFSKQSIRFYQNVVGPVFDVGGALANTLNAATFGTGADSIESRIQAAIDQAATSLISRVYIPANMYPYSASSISFNGNVQMVREGGDWSVYDVRAYGAYGDRSHVTADTAAFQSAISGQKVGGGTVFIPPGNYNIRTVNLWANMTLRGAGGGVGAIGGSRILWSNKDAATLSFTTTGLQTANLVIQDLMIDGNGVTAPIGNAINVQNATTVLIERVSCTNASNSTAAGINFDFCLDSTIRNCAIRSVATGVAFVNAANNNSVIGTIFIPIANGICVNVENNIQQTLIEGCNFEGASLANTIGVRLMAARATCLVGNYMEFFTTACVQPLVNTRGTVLMGNVLNATDAATACIPASSDINLVLIGNEFQNIGSAGFAPTGIVLGATATSSSFMFGNRISGGGPGPLITFGDGVTLSGADGQWGDAQVFTLTDAATIAVNAMVGAAVKVTLTGNRTMGAPTNATNGQRILFTIVQDGTGGRTLAWNAVFKQTWSDAGNTAAKRSSIAYVYDGTNWNQDGNQTPYV